jgi:hypothetical protein
MKAYHRYVLRKERKKISRHINEIIPVEDREVSKVMFDEYEDVTGGSNDDVSEEGQ